MSMKTSRIRMNNSRQKSSATETSDNKNPSKVSQSSLANNLWMCSKKQETLSRNTLQNANQ